MSLLPNLTDMLMNRADIKGASPSAPDPTSIGAASPSRTRSEESDPNRPEIGNPDKPVKGKPPTTSFQAKVRESHARLAAKSKPQAPAQNGHAQSARSTKNDGAKENGRSNGSEKSVRNQGQARTESGRPRLHKGAEASHANRDNASQGKATDTDDVRNQAAQANASDGSTDQDAQASDAKELSKLQDSLKKIGISATIEQLQDPAFMQNLLKMLQAMAETGSDADQGNADVTSVDGVGADDKTTAALPVDVTAQSQDANSKADATADAANATGATVTGKLPTDPDAAKLESQADIDPKDRAEIAALIKNKLAAMANGAKDPMVQASGDASKPVQVGPKNANADAAQPDMPDWRAVRGRTSDAPVDPLPMGDLDKMRVLQASALQASRAAQDGNTAGGALARNKDSIDGVQDAKASQAWSFAGHDADAGHQEDPQTDLFNQNGQAHIGDAGAAKEGAPLAKDNAAIPQFQQSMDQARTLDHKVAAERVWAPHQPASESGVLDQIKGKMAALNHHSSDEISIQLDPEHLGKVQVSLEMKDGTVNARIGVENENVRQIVEDNLGTLRDSLENQGIKLAGLEVSVDQRHGSLFNPDGSNSESFFHRPGRESVSSVNGAGEAAFESAPEADTGRRWGYNTMEYIG